LLPSPSGQWVALRAEREKPHALALWFVDLASGEFRPWEQAEPTDAGMSWRGERLEVEVRQDGRRQLLSIDPRSGQAVAGEPAAGGATSPAFTGEWARTVITRRAGGRRVLTIEWPEPDLAFELPGGPDTEWRLCEIPGLVFFGESEGGLLCVRRHDLRTGITAEVALIALSGGERPRWAPSPGGTLVAVSEGGRARIVDAESRETVSGPWPGGEVGWLADTGDAHALLAALGHRYVLDLYAGRRVDLGTDAGPAPEVRPLAGGGYLVRSGERLEHLDAGGELVQRLLPAEPEPQHARRADPEPLSGS
jgi:hypothetical protein